MEFIEAVRLKEKNRYWDIIKKFRSLGGPDDPSRDMVIENNVKSILQMLPTTL